MREDKYVSMTALLAAENPNHYAIRRIPRNSNIAILAPHGGKIEPGTSEIAEAIAGNDYNFFAFEGRMSRSNYDSLHVTSSHYDQETCLDLIKTCDYVVAIHGWGTSDRLIYIGGLDEPLKTRIAERLDAAGFRTESTGRMHLQATSPRNICNRGRRGKGAQLEISASLRKEFTAARVRNASLATFASAVRRAISDVVSA